MVNTRNVALSVSVASTAWAGGLACQLVATAAVIDISDITQFFYHDKSSLTSLNKGKSTDLQKLLKYFSRTSYVYNLLIIAGAAPVIFVLCSKDLLVVALLLFIVKLATTSLSLSFISSS